MDPISGVLKIRIRRGIDLVVCDTISSDPYVVVTMGNQKAKTRVIKKSLNPVWNEELTLSVNDPNLPVKLTVFDKDTLTEDDKMGDATIDIRPLIEAIRMDLQGLPNGTKVDRVQPSKDNCLSDESCIIWNDGKMTQDMILRLKNVAHGELEIQIEWIDGNEESYGISSRGVDYFSAGNSSSSKTSRGKRATLSAAMSSLEQKKRDVITNIKTKTKR